MHVLSVLTAGTAFLGAAGAMPARSADPGVAALLTPGNSRVILGRYIVKMRVGAEVSAAASGYDRIHTYNSAGFKGFAVALNDEDLEAVRRNPDVSIGFNYPWHDHIPWQQELNRLRHRSSMSSKIMRSTCLSTYPKRVLLGVSHESRIVIMASRIMYMTAAPAKAPA